MAGENVQDWSTTAATNSAADSSIGWAEGQDPGTVNNSARSMMAAVAKWRNLLNGSITTGGSANAQTVTSGVGFSSIPTGLCLRVKIGFTNTLTATLNVDTVGAVTIKDQSGNNLAGGELLLNSYCDFRYNGTNWVLLTPTRLPATTFSAGITATTGTFSGAVSMAALTAAGGTFTGTVQGSALVAAATATTGTVYFGSNQSDYLACDGATYTFGPGNVIVTGNLGTTGTGVFTGNISTTGTVISALDQGFYYYFASGSNHAYSLADSATGNVRWVTGTSAPATRMTLTANTGNLTLTGTMTAAAYVTSSDERLKEDLQPVANPGAVIDATEVHGFRWKESGKHAFGVLAQHAAGVFPYAVLHDEEADTWGVDYSRYVPILLAEVKALRARVASLEAA